MLRRARNEIELPYLIEQLTAAGDNAPGLEQKLELLRAAREHSRDAAQKLDEALLQEQARLRRGLREAHESQRKLKAVLDKLGATPWHPATFLGAATTAEQDAAMVAFGSVRRVVGFADGVDSASLEIGDEVLLGNELNVIVGSSPYRAFGSGETAVFDRYAGDDRVVLRSRDEEVVVDLAGALRDEPLRSGDRVRFDRNLWLAFEKLERSSGAQLFLEETPEETFDAIGGLDAQIEKLQRSILLHAHHRDTVKRYRLPRKGSVLLVGPPGTGKTMLARAFANWLAQLSPSRRARFMNVKPASLHSVWYSQSEANYREAFRVAREAGEQEPEVPVVMFFDEVDAIGGTRGESLMRVDDRVLTAFMTELDGLESRGNILVVAATNRRGALDPALLRPGRLGDLLLEVPRPNLNAARAIFAKHLSEEIPYAGEAGSGAAARREIIEAAVARIYSPNGEGELAKLTFRDGKLRSVRGADLISGAMIASIARAAVERACLREVEAREAGVRPADLFEAIADELESQARALTPANCHRYLADLPQDVDVVRVEHMERRVGRPHRYLNVA